MRFWCTTLLVIVAACGSDADPDGDTGAAGTDTDTTTTTTDTGPPEDRSALLQGTISSAAGPIEGANIRFCRGPECRYATTDAAGAYEFANAVVDWHSLEIVPPEGSGLATGFAPVVLATEEQRTVDVVLPPLDPPVTLGATAEHELGSGLFVTVGAADLEPPLFVDPATEAAGVQVSQDIWPPVDDPGTVLAVWYLSPFDHHAVPAGGLPFRIENQWMLPEGNSYEVWVGSYTDSAWLDAGTVTVGADGYLAGSGGLPLMSTVVLVDTASSR